MSKEFQYYTVAEVSNNGFYPVPEKLFNNKYYQNRVLKDKTIQTKQGPKVIEVETYEERLGDTAKLMFGIFCRYLNMSLTNGWFDSKKRVFVKLSVTRLCKILNKSRDTIIKYKRQLEEEGLLRIVKTDYENDIFYIGKVKEKAPEDVILELEDRRVIKTSKGEDLEVDEDGVVLEAGVVEETYEDVLKMEFPRLHLNKNTIANIKKHLDESLEELKILVAFVKKTKKKIRPNTLVAIARDKDYKAGVNEVKLDPLTLSRLTKAEFMKEHLGEMKVEEIKQEIIKDYQDLNIFYSKEQLETELTSNLSQRFNRYIKDGGEYR